MNAERGHGVKMVGHMSTTTTRRQADSNAPGARLLLVDDHDIVRSGLKLLLERTLGYEVIEVASADHALTAAHEHTPDVVLLDIRMPERDGLWALEQLRRQHPDMSVLMLSTYHIDEDVDASLSGGARGFVLKEASADQLREAITTALDEHGVYLHPKVAERLLRRGIRHRGAAAELSPREHDVLQRVCEGLTNDEIAERLFVSAKTVKSHLTNIYRKLGVSNRTQAVSKALREELVGRD